MNAYLLSLNKEANIADQWDFGLVKDFLTGRLWKTPDWQEFNIEQTDFIPTGERAIVVLPARHHKDMVKQINEELFQLEHVVLFLLGDEEAEFPVEQIEHPSIHIWVQNPHLGRHDAYNRIGTGYPAHLHDYVREYIAKDTDIFFAGQVTHERRTALQETLNDMERKGYEVDAIYTEGFTQGLDKPAYYERLAKARIAPAPSGAVIPDSFRLFEALECMAIPVADKQLPNGEVWEYWDWLFGEIVPFPSINDWGAMYEITEVAKSKYPDNIHYQTQWWIHFKRKFVYKVMEQLHGL